MTNIDLEGFFWADEPAQQVRGHLTFTERTGELALESPLPHDELDTIRGTTLLGEPLCLRDCLVRQHTIGAVQYSQIWHIGRLLMGTHDPDPRVLAVAISIADFHLFYGSPLIDIERGPEEEGDRVDIRWVAGHKLSVQLVDMRLVIDHSYHVHGDGNHLELDAGPSIHFECVTPGPAAPLREAIHPLLVLTNICLRRPVQLLDEHLELPDGSEIREAFGQRPTIEEGRHPQPWLMLGNLQPLDRSLSRWYTFAAELPSAFAMVAEYAQAGSTTTWEDRLLYLGRFLEQYHRARYSSLRLTKDEFKARRAKVDSILRGSNDAYLADWVDSLIAHGNERRLAERLQELVESLGEIVSPIVGDVTNWAKAVADTRNYYTHYSSYLADRAARGFDLVVMTRQVWWVVRACLLREMGFDKAESIHLFGFDSEQGWLRRMAVGSTSD